MIANPPPPGLCVPCNVRVVFSPDHFLIDLDGGCEIEFYAIGVVPVEKLRRDPREANDKIHDLLEAAPVVTAWIPQPTYDRDWIRKIHPQARHAGMLFVDGEPLTDLIRKFWPIESEQAA